jgi:hypothetical protein
MDAGVDDEARFRAAVQRLWRALGYSDDPVTVAMLHGEADRLEHERDFPTWGIADEAEAARREREEALYLLVSDSAALLQWIIDNDMDAASAWRNRAERLLGSDHAQRAVQQALAKGALAKGVHS